MYVQDATSAGGWRWAISSGNNPGNTGDHQGSLGRVVAFRRDFDGNMLIHPAAGGSMSGSALLQRSANKTFTSSLGEMARAP